jgi:hydrogenase expression/formation protein HypD
MTGERELAGRLSARIGEAVDRIGRPVRIMEVCGTHTVELRRQGILSLLPRGVTLVSGPGCPVCVTPAGYIDNALALVDGGRAIVASFGDMLRVPGASGEALSTRSATGRVRLVYSPSELLPMAAGTGLPVVFLAVGFETTQPAVLGALLEAMERGITSLLLYTAFKAVPPALRFLLSDPGHGIDGFLLPGHVSAVIGPEAYAFLEGPGGRPGVITGFEPLDMLAGILMILRQVERREARVENAYPRAVHQGGNPEARGLMDRCLEPSDEPWRGLGGIPGGSLGLRGWLAGHDAAAAFSLPAAADAPAPGCLCGSVIAGRASPEECELFGAACTPETPVGPCMVSSEGTCAAHLRYGGIL